MLDGTLALVDDADRGEDPPHPATVNPRANAEIASLFPALVCRWHKSLIYTCHKAEIAPEARYFLFPLIFLAVVFRRCFFFGLPTPFFGGLSTVPDPVGKLIEGVAINGGVSG